jgi:hypothetical protein
MRSLDPIVANGGQTPGSHLVTVDDHDIPVIIEANASNSGLDVIGSGWRVSITTHKPDGTPAPLEPGGIMTFTQGSKLNVSGSGFDELSQVRIYLMTDITHLGSLMTDRTGDFSGTVVVPAEARVGPDTLQINGFTRDRLVRSVSLGVRVKSAEVAKPVSVGTRIYFGYRSAVLSPKAKRSLMAMIAQVPPGGSASAVVTASLRSRGATSFDRSLAVKRASVVRRYLMAHDEWVTVASRVRRVAVRDDFRDRRVDVSVRMRP